MVKPCADGWRTTHSSSLLAAASSTFTPSHLGRGWQYDTGRKPGWQFNASSAASAQKIGTKEVKLSPHISFEIELGTDPRLVISFMRSYSNFGRAVWWIDDGKDAAVEMLQQQERFNSWCDTARCFKGGAVTQKPGPSCSLSSGETLAFVPQWTRNITMGGSLGISRWKPTPDARVTLVGRPKM